MSGNMTTISYGNATTRQPYVKPFDDEVIVLSGVVILIFFIIGIILNTITILVIRSTDKLRNAFMYFILSLCASDLMSALISPLFWYRRTLGFNIWVPPNFFCKLFWSVDLMTTFSTSMHILNFAILRYLSIQHVTTFQRISMKGVKIWISVTWLVAFLCGFIPLWIFTGADPGVERDRYSGEPNAKWPACTLLLETIDHYTRFSMTSYSLFILLPMVAVGIVSAFICRSVHDHAKASLVGSNKALKKRARKERQAVFQLVLIVISFLFGYLPFVTYEIWSLTNTDAVADYWFGLCQYFCLRFSECMNPVFYNISSSKMRRHTKRYITKICKCCHCEDVLGLQPTSETTSVDVGVTNLGV